MLKKTDKDDQSHKREQSSRNGAGKKHHIQHSDKDWRRTPEWAVYYKAPAIPVSELISLARRMEKMQQIRETYLGKELSSLGEPVWKILIQLLIAIEERQQISVSEISRLTSLPQAIADRYLKVLEKNGHIVRTEQKCGQGMALLNLSQDGHSLMRKLLLRLDSI